MNKIVEVYRKDQNNVGDMYSNPLRYFVDSSRVISIDIDNPFDFTWPDDVPMVFGGGGLIGNELFGNMIDIITEGADSASIDKMWESRWILKNINNKEIYESFQEQFSKLVASLKRNIHQNKGVKILWGAGHNTRGWLPDKDTITWPKWLQKFDAVGVRDFGRGEKWVPCASCMHPAFDKTYDVTNKIIWFEHKKQLIPSGEFGKEPIPRFVNSGQNMDQTIALLGSAETVVTNSYHGAYWATLLKKKVVVVNPWSSKFFYMKHKPAFAKSKDWMDSLKDAVSYPSALEECRSANINFYNSIKGFLE